MWCGVVCVQQLHWAMCLLRERPNRAVCATDLVYGTRGRSERDNMDVDCAAPGGAYNLYRVLLCHYEIKPPGLPNKNLDSIYPPFLVI